jgi:hypothetical protein
VRELLRRRLRFRCEARDRNLFQAVALREVAEGGMTGHDLAARATSQAGAILAVELPEPGDECARRTVERGANPANDPFEQDRIEPDMRVGGQPFLAALVEGQAGEDVDPLAVRLVDRLADGRLKAPAEVQDDGGALDPPDCLGRQLEVVRFGARRRQVLDVEVRPANALCGKGEGIEGGDHGPLPTPRGAAAAG